MSVKIIKVFAISIILYSPFSLSTDRTTLVQQCAVCHGSNGISANSAWPNLAGQNKGYIVTQLKRFKSGARKNALMTPVLNNLTDQDMEFLADYYSSQQVAIPPAKVINQQGRNVSGYCMPCHTAKGYAVNDEWPNISGQHADYLFNQLMSIKTGKRQSMIMNSVISDMTEEQLRSVADYYQQIGN